MKFLPLFISMLAGLATASHANPEPPSDPLVGTADASGRIILHMFTGPNGKKIPAPLVTDYGIVMCRRANGTALFVLGDKARQSVTEYSNYELFINALTALPSGSVLTIYDRGQLPVFYDFYPVHKELYNKLERAIAKQGIRISEVRKLTGVSGAGS